MFNAYGPPVLFLGKDKGSSLSSFSGGIGPLAGIVPSALTQTTLDGPALIVAQKTFVRDVLARQVGPVAGERPIQRRPNRRVGLGGDGDRHRRRRS